MDLKKKLQEHLVYWNPFIQPLLRLILGGIFLASGWEKLQHMDEFHQIVLNYRVLPVPLAHFYASLLPWLEMLCGGYVLLGLFTRWAAAGLCLLLVSFMIAIGIVLVRGEPLEDCGCFIGGKSEPVTIDLLLRDLGILAAACYVMLMPAGRWSLDNLLKKEKGP